VRRRASFIALLLVCLGGLSALALVSSAGRGGGRTAGAGTRDRYLGPIAPGARVLFGLTLRMRSAALERYATAVGAGTRRPLTAALIGERFGVSTAALDHLRGLLEAEGVRVEETFKQRTQILLSAPAARVERLLGVPLGEFADARGGDYHRPLAQPVIPPALRSSVLATTLLDTKRIPVSEDVPAHGMTGPDLAALYDLQPLIKQGLDGSGQTVAVFSGDTFRASDIEAFDREHNLVGAPSIERVEVEGHVPSVSGSEQEKERAEGEVDLDLETIRELAPKAHIINYEITATPDTFTVGIDRIVSDGRAKLVNFSYGYCELGYNSLQALQQADQNSLSSAETANVTLFVSSGDQGAYECQRNDPTNHELSVPWPGSSPHVVSVGGTYVDVRRDGTRLDEVGWEEILRHAGGGGGLSAIFPRPSWQTEAACSTPTSTRCVKGINNQYTTNPPRRQVPDVAADASPASGYAIYQRGQDIPGVGGTSAAAPFWTGSFALIDQLAQRKTGHLLPFIAPLLYKAAARDPAAFYDVTLGGNRFYRAGEGWDYSTGLGVPNMAVLSKDVIAAARGH
jgi:subtilase family serine protease